MKIHILIVVLASGVAHASGFTFIQDKHCNQADSCAFGSNVGSGHLLIFAAGANDTGTTGWAPSGTQNTYSQAILTAGGNNTAREFGIYYQCNSISGAETVTANANTAPSYRDYYLAEYSYSGTCSLDGPGKASAFSSCTSCATGNFTVTTNDLIVANGLCAGGGRSVGSGYTERDNPASDGFFYLNDKTETTTTANATETCTSHPDNLIEAAAFKASGSVKTCTVAAAGGGAC